MSQSLSQTSQVQVRVALRNAVTPALMRMVGAIGKPMPSWVLTNGSADAAQAQEEARTREVTVDDALAACESTCQNMEDAGTRIGQLITDYVDRLDSLGCPPE